MWIGTNIFLFVSSKVLLLIIILLSFALLIPAIQLIMEVFPAPEGPKKQFIPSFKFILTLIIKLDIFVLIDTIFFFKTIFYILQFYQKLFLIILRLL